MTGGRQGLRLGVGVLLVLKGDLGGVGANAGGLASGGVVTALVTSAVTFSTWVASLVQVKVAEAVKSSLHFHTGSP